MGPCVNRIKHDRFDNEPICFIVFFFFMFAFIPHREVRLAICIFLSLFLIIFHPLLLCPFPQRLPSIHIIPVFFTFWSLSVSLAIWCSNHFNIYFPLIFLVMSITPNTPITPSYMFIANSIQLIHTSHLTSHSYFYNFNVYFLFFIYTSNIRICNNPFYVQWPNALS